MDPQSPVPVSPPPSTRPGDPVPLPGPIRSKIKSLLPVIGLVLILPLIAGAIKYRQLIFPKASTPPPPLSVNANPEVITTSPNSQPTYLSASANYIGQTLTDVVFSWSISTTNSIGDLKVDPNNTKIATFVPSGNSGCGYIRIQTEYLGVTAERSIPVSSGVVCQFIPTPTPAAGLSSLFGKQVKFDNEGANDSYITYLPPSPLAEGSYTVEAWVNISRPTSGNYLRDYSLVTYSKPQTIADYGYLFKLGLETNESDGTSRPTFSALTNGTSSANSNYASVGGTSPITLASNVWHHIAVTAVANSGSCDLKLFINGHLADSSSRGSGNSNPCAFSTQQPKDILISKPLDNLGGISAFYYSGQVEELRISKGERYSGDFSLPDGPFAADGNTLSLFHFENQTGDASTSDSANGNSASVQGPHVSFVGVDLPTPTGGPTPTPTPTPVSSPLPPQWIKMGTYTVGCNSTLPTSFSASQMKFQMISGGGRDNHISFYIYGSTGASWLTSDKQKYEVTNKSGALDVGEWRETAPFGSEKQVVQQTFSVGCNDGETMTVDVYKLASPSPTPIPTNCSGQPDYTKCQQVASCPTCAPNQPCPAIACLPVYGYCLGGKCIIATPIPTPLPTPISSPIPSSWQKVGTYTVGCKSTLPVSYPASQMKFQMISGGGRDNHISFYIYGSNGAKWTTSSSSYEVTNKSQALNVGEWRETAPFPFTQTVNQQYFSVGCNDGETMTVDVYRFGPGGTSTPTPIPTSKPVPTPTPPPPPGCYYQQVACIQAPCDPTLICPTPGPTPTPTPIATTPQPTSIPLPTPTPTPQSNRIPVITTQSLPSGVRWGLYQTQVTGYDLDSDNLSFQLVQPPIGFWLIQCSQQTSQTQSQLVCNLIGLPYWSGVKDINLSLQDNRGGTAQTSLPLTIR